LSQAISIEKPHDRLNQANVMPGAGGILLDQKPSLWTSLHRFAGDGKSLARASLLQGSLLQGSLLQDEVGIGPIVETVTCDPPAERAAPMTHAIVLSCGLASMAFFASGVRRR
jgi:hypothetical protein